MKPILIILLLACSALADIPRQINYQGYLTSSNGMPLDTTVGITFKLYTDSTAGTLLWTETRTSVFVSGGLFSVKLGQGTVLPDSLLNETELWLGTTVGADGEMTPRTRLVSAGYAYRVGTVDGASGGTVDGKINVGNGNTNEGIYASVFGQNNHASGIYSFVGGGITNFAMNDYSIVCGGFANLAQNQAFVGGGVNNNALGDLSVVVGGQSNTANGPLSFIGGGYLNSANGDQSSISGGQSNFCSGSFSTIVGGRDNEASGNCAIAGGYRCSAEGDFSTALGTNVSVSADSAFAWSDGSGPLFSIGADNTFSVKAHGGFRFWTTANHADNIGARLPAGGSAWTTLSDSTKKQNIRAVDTQSILGKVVSLPIKQWSYKSQDPGIEHIGPMAQDFWQQFHIGDDSLSISTIDPSGIALAAIQELAKENLKLQTSKSELEARIEGLERRMAEMEGAKGNLMQADYRGR